MGFCSSQDSVYKHLDSFCIECIILRHHSAEQMMDMLTGRFIVYRICDLEQDFNEPLALMMKILI